MTEKQLNQLTEFAAANGICTFTLTCIFHIAAKEAAKADIVRDYGIIVCEELRRLGEEMDNKQIGFCYQI